ncbi:helicase-related protein [Prauserella endophytica]|uniref:Helicase n=1 Tax=Prauserella endophytica TaxID=1592324 RepID=A0ABY2RUX7_9PSEU|nr:helicase-related protein [Prauserella endophytica]TKG61547.1 helicase [Prauserella endophytica]
MAGAGQQQPVARDAPELTPDTIPAAVDDGGGRRRAGPAVWRPSSQDDLAPSGTVSRVRANLKALTYLRQLQVERRPATADEQAVLARWSGWGAAAQVFDTRRDEFAWARAELDELLGSTERAAAERNVLNAHYTDLGLVREIWTAVEDLGFSDGRVLEPGCGIGHFIGTAPEGADVVGVELDPISAGIAERLYPGTQILTESFADTRAEDATFDLAIGNVPFGDAALTDRRHNPSGHSIHNHFLLKSLHLTKPGGVVAVLTSRYTMDSVNPAARREMAQLADLLGAVRLPSGAHQRAAGTQAVTDLLILRRREPDRDPQPVAWERAEKVRLGENDTEIPINTYFRTHPEMVLGRMSTGDGHGMYRADDLHVAADRPLVPALRDALGVLTRTARDSGLDLAPVEADPQRRPAALVAAADQRPEGHITAVDDGTFTVVVGGREQPHAVPASQAGELRALLGLRDTVVTLLRTEAADLNDTTELDALRGELNTRYDDYAARYGPINRFSLRRTGRTDPETGEDKYARIRPQQGGFRLDPYAPTVQALERFDSASQTATKDDIFARRVVAPRAPRLGADSPSDALAICLDTHAEVRLDDVARLLGASTDDARAQLGTLVFDEPGTDRLVPAAEYLSGNVRRKLAAAEQAAATDTRYAPNISALREVIPADIPPEEIAAQLGSIWIGEDDVQTFLRDTLQDGSLVVQHAGASNWQVSGRKLGVAATETWGTERAPASMLAQALLQQRPITVFDTIPGGPGESDRRVLNMDATVLAQEKATALNERFSEWVWEDPARAERLARTYNDQFNAIVTRSYDDAQLSLPGLALTFEPRSHQVAAVARMIHEPAVGLYHEVGAGKTAEMTMGCMELRRLGLVRKPCVIVPNHMLEQFGREWAQLYPQAKLLVASSDDLSGHRRREFVARCATGDWDAVILTRGAFERIPMSPEAQGAYLEREVEVMRAQLEKVQSRENPLGVKRMQAALLRAEERVKSKLDGDRDPGLTFEATGIDYLVVDEAHGYKNLRTPSNIPGAGIDGSNRASDLDMKLHYLRERHGNRVGTFATATPIANSVTEAYVMQRYLRPDLLEDAGIEDFDSWAATFGQSVTAIELSPDSSSFRLKTRFAKFRNVPELLRMWHLSADIKTAVDLDLATPDLAQRPDGQREPETISVPASPELERYIADIAERADRVRSGGVDPTEDNMLKISSDGRAAALDIRLVGGSTPDISKVHVVADNIAEIHTAHRDDAYPGPEGGEHPVRGSLQLVFCDLGTPKNDGSWSVYGELRDQLAARGVPREQVRFMHEARTDREKGELFAAARAGRIAVLLGSTERMGVGTNVQARAVALHHMDCPWRPADLAQRDGRIIRQGNLNPNVRILRYVTEGSFDGYSWQTVARKAEFISQVMRGRLDTREIEDIGDTALNYNEVKALATGNPLLLDHAQAKADVIRLERLARGHDRAQRRLPDLITTTKASLVRLHTEQQHADHALHARRPTRGEAFTMTINGTRTTERTTAQHHLIEHLHRFQRDCSGLGTGQSATLERFAQLGGVELTAVAYQPMASPDPDVAVQIHGLANTAVTLKDKDWTSGGTGVIARLENRLGDLDALRAKISTDIDSGYTEIQRSEAQIGKPFPRAADLADAQARLDVIEHDMAAQAAEDNRSPDTEQPGAEDPSTTPDTGGEASPSTTPLPKTHPARLAAMASPSPAETPDQHKHQPLATMNRVAPRQPNGELER